MKAKASKVRINRYRVDAICMQMRASGPFEIAMAKGGDTRRKALVDSLIQLDEVTLGELMKIPSNITPMDFYRACSELINAEKEFERGPR